MIRTTAWRRGGEKEDDNKAGSSQLGDGKEVVLELTEAFPLLSVACLVCCLVRWCALSVVSAG